MESNQEERRVYQFILEKIESVPHLEALLLLWNTRPTKWSAEEVSKRLYVAQEVARKLLEDLSREEMIAAIPGSEKQYLYESSSKEKDRLVELVDETYRNQVVRVSTMIHSKASSAVRDFARAFRFTKEKE